MKKIFIGIFVVIFIISFAFIGVGCKEEAAPAEEIAEEEEAAVEEEEEAAPQEVELIQSQVNPGLEIPVLPDKKIYYVESFLADPPHVMMVAGAEQIFKEMQVEWEILNPDMDLQRQIAMVDDVLVKGDADAIIISAVDSEGMVDSVKKCNEAEIPVFSIDRWVTGGDIEFGVGGDWYYHGKIATENLVKLLTEKYGEPKGKVAALIAGQDVVALRLRVDALRDVLAEYPNITLLEKLGTFDLDSNAKIIQDTLIANPDVDGIWLNADYFGLKYIPALEEIDKLFPVGDERHIIIQSMDGNDWAHQAIRDGFFDSTASSYFIDWGNILAWAIGQYFIYEGKPEFPYGPFDIGATWVGEITDYVNGPYLGITSALVTKENVDDPALWGNRLEEFE